MSGRAHAMTTPSHLIHPHPNRLSYDPEQRHTCGQAKREVECVTITYVCHPLMSAIAR